MSLMRYAEYSRIPTLLDWRSLGAPMVVAEPGPHWADLPWRTSSANTVLGRTPILALLDLDLAATTAFVPTTVRTTIVLEWLLWPLEEALAVVDQHLLGLM